MTTIEVNGAVCGQMWMPPVQGWREESARYTLHGTPDPFALKVDSIREALELTAAKDGDFQTAGKLTANTCFTVTREHGRRKVSRTYAVADFPVALAGIVDPDMFQEL